MIPKQPLHILHPKNRSSWQWIFAIVPDSPNLQILGKYLFCQCPHLCHGWGAFEGFDFVGEAADVGVGRAFGLFRNGGAKKFPCNW